MLRVVYTSGLSYTTAGPPIDTICLSPSPDPVGPPDQKKLRFRDTLGEGDRQMASIGGPGVV